MTDTDYRLWGCYPYQVLSTEYIADDLDADIGSFTKVYTVKHSIPDDRIEEFVQLRFPTERCAHEHDCCGNWYARRSHIETNADGMMTVHQRYTLNI